MWDVILLFNRRSKKKGHSLNFSLIWLIRFW